MLKTAFILLRAVLPLLGANRLQVGPLPKYQVKAALLYKLSRFIQWSAAAFAAAFAADDAALAFCVWGTNPLGHY